MISAERAHLQVAAHTHPGMTGKNNEDRYAVSAYRLSQADPTPSVLAVLCDGIGGHRAGEIAAEMAVNSITRVVGESDGSRPVEILRTAVVVASQEIYSRAQSESNQLGMGATCACAWIIGEKMYTATVGDSRIYLVRAGQIQQLNVDHTWIQEALDSGALHPEDVRGHPNAHVIRRFLGSPNPPDVDFRLRTGGEVTPSQAVEANQGLRLQPGDRVLLCSDGLTDLVSNPEILATLGAQAPTAAVQSLVDQANARGGHDNITVVVLSMPAAAKMGVTRPLKKKKPLRWGWILTGCLGVTVIALAAGFVLFSLGVFGAWGISLPSAQTPAPTYTLPPLLQTMLPQPATPAPGILPPTVTPTPLVGYPAPQETPSQPIPTAIPTTL